MGASPQKFGQLLTEAVHRIRMRESNKLVSIVQDELGYALGFVLSPAAFSAQDHAA